MIKMCTFKGQAEKTLMTSLRHHQRAQFSFFTMIQKNPQKNPTICLFSITKAKWFKKEKMQLTQLYPIITWIHRARLFGSIPLWANVSLWFSCIRLRPWPVLLVAAILSLMVRVGLANDRTVQVQFTAQAGVEHLAAPQLLLQSPVLPLQALQPAGTGHTFLLRSTYGRDGCSRPIRRVSLA